MFDKFKSKLTLLGSSDYTKVMECLYSNEPFEILGQKFTVWGVSREYDFSIGIETLTIEVQCIL